MEANMYARPSIKPRPDSVMSGFQADTSPPPGTLLADRDDYNWLPRVKNAPRRFVSFPSAQENSKSSSENLVPNISSYVPTGMDMDAVNTLSALYITHTVGLIEAIRYVKMKQVLVPMRRLLIVVSEFNIWLSWNVDRSRSTRPQFPRPRPLGPKSRFRNVQSTLPTPNLSNVPGNNPHPLPSSPTSRPPHN